MKAFFINSRLVPIALGADALIVHPHAQRTGGNTIRRKVLEAVYGRGGVYNQFNVHNAKKWPDLTDEDVRGFRAFTDHFDFRKNALTRLCLPIAVIRHPLYRAVSLYNFVRNKPEHRHHDLAVNSSLEDFYRKGSRETPGYFRELQCRRVCGFADARVALRTIDEKYLALGFTEHLAEFAGALGNALGWPVLDVSGTEPQDAERYDALITPAFRAQVLADNAQDLLLYETMLGGDPRALPRRTLGGELRVFVGHAKQWARGARSRLKRAVKTR